MADQAPLKATFFAFQKREPGGQLLKAGIAFAVSSFLLFVFFALAVIALIGSALLTQLAGGEPPDPETMAPQIMGRLLLVFPLEFVFLFGFFVLLSAFESACLRWMIRGETSSPFGMHFGKDMWRAYGTYWCWALYMIVGWIGCFIAVGVVGWVGAMVLGRTGAMLAIVAGLAYLIAWFVMTVRLAPATATSIAIGKFAPLQALTATRGRFWALFGSFLLLFVLYLVFVSLTYGVQIALFFAPAFTDIDWSTAASDPVTFNEDYNRAIMGAFAAIFSKPASIIAYIGLSIVAYAIAMVFYVVFYGVNARAVQAALDEDKIAPGAAS